jgi:mannosyltransferase
VFLLSRGKVSSKKYSYANLQSITLILLLFCFLISINLLNLNNFILYDDSWGAAAVLGNPYEFIVFTLRWDLHPPLYYSVLDLWAILGKSDLWLQSSSSFFHALTVGITFHFLRKHYTLLFSLSLSLLVLTSPLLLEYSFKVRMHSFVALLSTVLFFAIEAYVLNNKKHLLKWILLLGFVISNSHAIGILFVLFHFLYGLLLCYGNDKNSIKGWVLGHLVVALFAVPAILNSMVKSVSHAQTPEVKDVFNLLTNLFVEQGTVLGALTLLIVVVLLTIYKQRSILICYLILPILFFSIISYALKPLWLERNFVFAIPIILVALLRSLRYIKLSIYIKASAILVFCGVNFYTFYNKTTQNNQSYSDLIGFLSEQTSVAKETSKVCIVSQNSLGPYWSLQRYLVGQNWGNPFEAPPPINETWLAISAELPAYVIKALYLGPHKNYKEYNAYVISAKYSNRCEQPDIGKVFYVGSYNQTLGGSLLFSNPWGDVFTLD